MRICLRKIVPCFLFSSQLIFSAQNLPRDLSQLQKNYQEIIRADRESISIEMRRTYRR